MLLAESLGADILAPGQGAIGSNVFKRFTALMCHAWNVFRHRNDYDVFLTMSEQVGLFFAFMLKLARSRRSHVMITHYMTPVRKSMFVKWLGVDSHITRFICYGTAQAAFLTNELGVPQEKVRVILHPADSEFWKPKSGSNGAGRVIVSAGRLARDYETLIEATDGLDVDVVIAADSPWVAGRKYEYNGKVPERVSFVRCGISEMRELYSRASFVVVPLHTVNIQAGSLVIYESMAMGKAVVTTANGGNVDIVTDNETGCYVPPHNTEALRKAICGLLEDPQRTERMGRDARKRVEEGLNLDTYVWQVAQVIREAHPEPETASSVVSNGVHPS